MKIGYFADGPWSHLSFEKIIADKSLEIAFVCARSDTHDSKLQEYAEKHKIPFLKHVDVNSQDFIKKIAEFKCDLFVSMSFNQIFKSELINLPTLKTINCHAGKLPFYRGRNILNWVLINDEKEFGITVHYVDEGIDTGDIIYQRTFPITDKDDYSTLLQTAYVGCAETLYKSVKMVQGGNVKRISQKEIHPIGMYCGMRKKGDEVLDWNQTSRQIFNFVRAICKPGPQTTSYLEGKEVKINKVCQIEGAPAYIGIVGQVIGKSGSNPLVKTKDSLIEILDYSSDVKLKVGDRLK